MSFISSITLPLFKQPLTRVGIIAAESSADQLGESVIQAIQAVYPNCQFEGIGGPKMQNLGFKSIFDCSDIAVMGVTEVLGSLFKILWIRCKIIKYFKKNPPDIFIGIDAPDFNLKVESNLKKANIPVIHTVSPSIWAWKAWRIHKIKRATDLVLCLFPFETEFYTKHQHPAVCIGHPLAEKISLRKLKSQSLQKLSLNLPNKTKTKTITIMPGSRVQEIKALLPVFLEGIENYFKNNKTKNILDYQFILPIAHPKLKALIQSIIGSKLDIILINGQSHDVLMSSDIAILASGTATLEAALCKTPMIVCYKVSKLTYWIGKQLIKIRHFALPNILLGFKNIVPELIQDECNTDNISKYLEIILNHKHSDYYYLNQKEKFKQLHQSLKLNTIETLQKTLCQYQPQSSKSKK